MMAESNGEQLVQGKLELFEVSDSQENDRLQQLKKIMNTTRTTVTTETKAVPVVPSAEEEEDEISDYELRRRILQETYDKRKKLAASSNGNQAQEASAASTRYDTRAYTRFVDSQMAAKFGGRWYGGKRKH